MSTMPPKFTNVQRPTPAENPLNELIWALAARHATRIPFTANKLLKLTLASCNPSDAQACAAKFAGILSVIRVNPPAVTGQVVC